MKTAERTLSGMDTQEFLAKVDTLFGHLERTVGDDAVGDWAVSSIKQEIRRRIMEKDTAVVIEPEPKRVSVEIKPVKFVPEGGCTAPVRPVTLYTVTLSQPGEQVHVRCGLPRSFVEAYLMGVADLSRFGVSLGDIPAGPPPTGYGY